MMLTSTLTLISNGLEYSEQYFKGDLDRTFLRHCYFNVRIYIFSIYIFSVLLSKLTKENIKTNKNNILSRLHHNIKHKTYHIE